MTKEEATKYLIDISYALGNTSIEHLTEKDGVKMREAVEVLQPAAEEETIKHLTNISKKINALTQMIQQKIGYCEDCKYFELDSWMNVNGIPLIVAHNICKRWGDGCKTKADGYCFMFESKEGEDKDEVKI